MVKFWALKRHSRNDHPALDTWSSKAVERTAPLNRANLTVGRQRRSARRAQTAVDAPTYPSLEVGRTEKTAQLAQTLGQQMGDNSNLRPTPSRRRGQYQRTRLSTSCTLGPRGLVVHKPDPAEDAKEGAGRPHVGGCTDAPKTLDCPSLLHTRCGAKGAIAQETRGRQTADKDSSDQRPGPIVHVGRL